MYKSVVIATVLVVVGYGYPTVNDIADFDTMRRLELGDAKPIDKSINYPPGEELEEIDNPQDYDIGAIKEAAKFNELIETKHKDRTEPEYLQPDWNAQGSLDMEEKLERVQRSFHAKSHGFSSEDDSFESHECFDDHEHHEDSDSDDSGPDESWEKHRKTTTGAKIGTNIDTDTDTTSTSTPRTSTSRIPVTTSTGFYPSVSTSRPEGRIDIDTRIGNGEREVRNKRMVWNVAQPSMEFEDDVKPVKMRWMWDDQKPAIVPPDNYDANNRFMKKTNFFVPNVPVVNYVEPCESVYERRDRHGRCRPVFA